MDRFSNLPNEILCHIVSFLSAKEAAFAKILSKRWQNLVTIVSSLEFDDSVENQKSLIDFVDEVLALPITTRIRKCSLKCHSSTDPELGTAIVIDQHINRCLRNVLKRGVLSLKLNIEVEESYLLPSEVFTCNTIVKLELTCNTIIEPHGLGYLVIDVIPENALLPALETLFLESFRFSDVCGCTFQMLLSACPVLKKLTIYDVEWENWTWSRIISSPTLERLCISRVEYDGFSGSDFKSISFDTPSLTYLEYDDFVPDEYPSVSFDSLVEAKLHLILTVDHEWPARYLDEDDPITSNPTNLIKGLRNVEILHLTSTETAQDKNMKRRESSMHEYYCGCSWGRCNCLLSCPVEVLKISNYKGTTKDVEKMKHFLGKLSCLELVKLGVVTRGDDKEKLRITTDLLMLQSIARSRSSSLKVTTKLMHEETNFGPS